MEKTDGLEKVIDTYQKISKELEDKPELQLALYGLLAEQLPEGLKAPLYAGLAMGYAQLADLAEDNTRETALSISQMYLAKAEKDYALLTNSKKVYGKSYGPAKLKGKYGADAGKYGIADGTYKAAKPAKAGKSSYNAAA
ncbi:hypothetical protein KY346_04680 [Candidatus Woesearchaeota archaeon]|nr:hypothetical protein [Candidatus Woesearchaeota archaeon]